jgi:hypothetical protein
LLIFEEKRRRSNNDDEGKGEAKAATVVAIYLILILILILILMGTNISMDLKIIMPTRNEASAMFIAITGRVPLGHGRLFIGGPSSVDIALTKVRHDRVNVSGKSKGAGRL